MMSLLSLPEETTQQIALILPDTDLCNFRVICRSTAAAIDAKPEHFWMYRFRARFDEPRHAKTLNQLKIMYQERSRILKYKTPTFKDGSTENEMSCLRLLFELIYDAQPECGKYGVPHSLNFKIIEDFCNNNSNVLAKILSRGQPSANGMENLPRSPEACRTVMARPSLMQLFQLVMSARSLSLNCHPAQQVWNFAESQRVVYMDPAHEPLFGGPSGLEVNTLWALHCVNFFRHHMLRKNEYTLGPAFANLTKSHHGLDVPQMWKDELMNLHATTDIGNNWKGSYAYLLKKEVNKLRSETLQAKTTFSDFQDRNVDLGDKAIQRLHIKTQDFDPHTSIWPERFEELLNAQGFLPQLTDRTTMPHPQRERRSHPHTISAQDVPGLESSYFSGGGYDDEKFLGCGWINQLPRQYEIPGWKRMTMMKFFIKDDGTIDGDALWCYEGIVLPGSEMIVGRWWGTERQNPNPAKHMIYSGPFILWNNDTGRAYRSQKRAAKGFKTLPAPEEACASVLNQLAQASNCS